MRLFRRLVIGCLVLVVLLAVFVGLLPTLVSAGLARGMIQSRLAARVSGDASFDRIRASWGGPQRIEGLVLTDRDGRTQVAVDVTVDHGLRAFVGGLPEELLVSVQGDARGVIDERGRPSFGDLIAAPADSGRVTSPASSGGSSGGTGDAAPVLPFGVRLAIDGLSVDLDVPVGDAIRPFQIESLTGSVVAGPGRTVDVDLQSPTVFDGTRGSFRAKTAIARLVDDTGRLTVLDARIDQGSVELRGFPVPAGDTPVKLESFDVTVRGALAATLDISVDGAAGFAGAPPSDFSGSATLSDLVRDGRFDLAEATWDVRALGDAIPTALIEPFLAETPVVAGRDLGTAMRLRVSASSDADSPLDIGVQSGRFTMDVQGRSLPDLGVDLSSIDIRARVHPELAAAFGPIELDGEVPVHVVVDPIRLERLDQLVSALDQVAWPTVTGRITVDEPVAARVTAGDDSADITVAGFVASGTWSPAGGGTTAAASDRGLGAIAHADPATVLAASALASVPAAGSPLAGSTFGARFESARLTIAHPLLPARAEATDVVLVARGGIDPSQAIDATLAAVVSQATDVAAGAEADAGDAAEDGDGAAGGEAATRLTNLDLAVTIDRSPGVIGTSASGAVDDAGDADAVADSDDDDVDGAPPVRLSTIRATLDDIDVVAVEQFLGLEPNTLTEWTGSGNGSLVVERPDDPSPAVMDALTAAEAAGRTVTLPPLRVTPTFETLDGIADILLDAETVHVATPRRLRTRVDGARLTELLAGGAAGDANDTNDAAGAGDAAGGPDAGQATASAATETAPVEILGRPWLLVSVDAARLPLALVRGEPVAPNAGAAALRVQTSGMRARPRGSRHVDLGRIAITVDAASLDAASVTIETLDQAIAPPAGAAAAAADADADPNPAAPAGDTAPASDTTPAGDAAPAGDAQPPASDPAPLAPRRARPPTPAEAGLGPAILASVRLEQLLVDGRISAATARTTGTATVERLATAFLDAFLGSDGTLEAALGARANVALDAEDFSIDTGRVTLDAMSVHGHLAGTIRGEAGTLVVEPTAPLTAEIDMHEGLRDQLLSKAQPIFAGVVSTDAPMRLTVSAARYPVAGPIEDAEASFTIDPTVVRFARGFDLLSVVAMLDGRSPEPEVRAEIGAIAGRLATGGVITEGTSVAFRKGAVLRIEPGTRYDLLARRIDMRATLPLQFLGSVFHELGDVTSDVQVPLVARGAVESASLEIDPSFDLAGELAGAGLRGLIERELEKELPGISDILRGIGGGGGGE